MRDGRTRRAVGTVVVAVAVAAATCPQPVAAAWSVPPSQGPAGSAAAALDVQATPVVGAAGLSATRTFTVTWADAPPGPVPVTGYVVSRTSSLLGAGLVSSGTCTGTTLAGVVGVVRPPLSGGTRSCTDVALVQLGVVRYAVTPVYERWVGPRSDWSNPVS